MTSSRITAGVLHRRSPQRSPGRASAAGRLPTSSGPRLDNPDELPLGISIFNDFVAALYVTEVAQSLEVECYATRAAIARRNANSVAAARNAVAAAIQSAALPPEASYTAPASVGKTAQPR